MAGSTLADMRSVSSYVIPSVSPGDTLNYNIVASENTPPHVSNVSAVQRTDGSGIVDITYNISDNEQATVDIELEYWDGSWHSCTNTTGDVGAGIATGTGKAATWSAEAQLGEIYIANCKIRVTANDGAGGTDSAESSAFNLDTARPTGYGCSSPANGVGGVPIDTALVSSTASDNSPPVEYKFIIATNDAFSENVQESGWQTATSWTPPTSLSYGTLYYWKVKARDAKGNESVWCTRFTFTTIFEFTYDLKAGWNMISLPLYTAETGKSALFPDALAIYTWDPEAKTYAVPTELVPGKGYWVLYLSPATQTIHGTPVMNYALSGIAGWHMIGSLWVDAELHVSAGSIYPTLYAWDPVGKSYVGTSTLEAGKGYWLLGLTNFTMTVEPKPPGP